MNDDQKHTEDRLMRIEEKVDQVSEKIGEINSTLSAQHVSLKEHIRRTNILEKKIEPIEKHVNMVSGIVKLIMIASAVAAIVAVMK